MGPLELGAFLALGTIWGASFLFIKWASDPQEGFPPLTLVALRLLLASVTMIAYNCVLFCMDRGHLRYFKHLVVERKDFMWKVVVMGILNNTIPFTLVAWAESNFYVNVGVASVIDSAIPIFAQLIGHFVLHEERLTLQRLVGILIGFAGVVVVCLEKIVKVGPVEADNEDRVRTLGYYILIVVATASYGMASVFGRMYLVDFPRTWAITGQIVTGAMVNTILSLAIEYHWPFDEFAGQTEYSFFQRASTQAWLSIAYLGLVATCGAYIFYFYLLHTVGSVKQAMVGFLLPVVGMALGIFVQHEWDRINDVYKTLQVGGALLVGFSIFLVNFRADGRQGAAKHKLSDAECAPLARDVGRSCEYGTVPAGRTAVMANGAVLGRTAVKDQTEC